MIDDMQENCLYFINKRKQSDDLKIDLQNQE